MTFELNGLDRPMGERRSGSAHRWAGEPDWVVDSETTPPEVSEDVRNALERLRRVADARSGGDQGDPSHLVSVAIRSGANIDAIAVAARLPREHVEEIAAADVAAQNFSSQDNK